MAAEEAKEARWTRAEAMMEYFMVGRRTEGVLLFYNLCEKRKDGCDWCCTVEKFGAVGIERVLELGRGNRVCR